MTVSILDATTRGAINAATTQQAQCEALIAAWSGGNVNAWVYNSSNTLLQRRVQGPWTINADSPRGVEPGAYVSFEHVATGTPAYVVYRTADTEIFSTDGITFAGNIKALCGTRDRAVVFSANAALPVSDALSNITIFSQTTDLPATSEDQTLLLFLHSSGGANYSTGRQYRADGSEALSYLTFTEIAWSTRTGGTALGHDVMQLRPVDYYDTRPGGFIRESRWLGFTSAGESGVRLITERRVDALMDWADQNLPVSATRRCVLGGSMGAWGCITYALRRPEKFAAVYADRPRWRWTNYPAETFSVYDWDDGSIGYSVGTAPNLSPADGGASVYDARINSIGYVANTANAVPWVGWCIGRNDGFAYFEDQIDAVNALRAGRRGFAFAWNDGNHTTGSIMSEITASYPYGLFELGKGYPLFENCSLDQDPGVDLEGGINIGLTFRNVVESATSWSCEVTHISSACTVDVSPISDVYTGSLTPQTINITAANSWVAVSFGA